MTYKAWQAKMRYRRRSHKSHKNPEEGGREKKYAYVYLMGMGNGLFKIGWTVNVHTRLTEFKTGNPLLELVHAEHVLNAHGCERALHHRFQEKRVSGEWFRLSESDIAAIKAYLAERTPPLVPDEMAYLRRGH
jgi:hypothetical protein